MAVAKVFEKLLGVLSLTFVLAVVAGLMMGCAKATEGVSSENQHVFISYAPANWTNPATLVLPSYTSPSDRAVCEAALQNAVCETNLTAQQIAAGWSHATCAPDSAKYVPTIMAFYDEMPARLRPSLCSIYRIFISDLIPSTAFASPILKDPYGAPVGAYIGARKSTFLAQPSVHALVSWKEQLPFGGSSEFLANDPRLLQIDYGLHTGLAADGLFYVLIHEMGHLIDFNNYAVRTNCLRNHESTHCAAEAGAFNALSWQTYENPLANASYLKQSEFCYYECAGKTINGNDAYDIYASMIKSGFITPYSGSNMREDFAEFFVWNLMSRYKGVNYRAQFPGRGDLDMNQGLINSALIRAKLDYMDRLWNSPGLKISNQ